MNWSVSGVDSDAFTITQLGELMFNSSPDYESATDSDANNVYNVNILAADDTSTTTYPVTVTVTNVNEAPEFPTETTSRSVEENAGADAEVGLPVAAIDPDEGDTLTYTLSGAGASSFSIDGDGQIRALSSLDSDVQATYEVTVDVHDGRAADGSPSAATDDTIVVTITVTDINEPPTLTGPSTPEFAENGTGDVATYTANDPEGTTVDWSLSGDDADDMDISGGVLLFTTAPDHEELETYSITVHASDGNSTSSLPVVVTVTDVNEQPEFPDTSTSRTVEENTGPNADVGLPVAAEDPDDGDTLTYALTGTDAASFIIDSNGQIRTVSDMDGELKSSYSVTVEVHDGRADDGSPSTTTDDSIVVSITVTDVNEPPTLTGPTTTEYPENATRVVATYQAVDPESVTPTWSLDGRDKDDFEITNGVLTFKSPPDYEERIVYQVTVQASDGNNIPGLAVTINIINVNEPPEFPSSETGRRSVVEDARMGQNVGLPVEAEDPDSGDTLTYTLVGDAAAAFEVDSTSGQIKAKTPLDRENLDTYTAQVNVHDGKDADGNPSTTTDDFVHVLIIVTDVNEPPVLNGTTTTEYAENETRLVETYVATDEERDLIRWSVSGVDADDFTITQAGDLAFASTPNYEDATDSDMDNEYLVTVQASDGNSTTTRVVTVTVTDINEDPVFLEESADRSVLENTLAGVNVGNPISAIDPDRDALTYTLLGDIATAFEIDSSGQLRTKIMIDREKASSYFGQVQIQDGNDADGNPSTAVDDGISVTVTVEDVNEPPVVSGTSTIQYAENDTRSVDTYTADDPESDRITWSLSGADADDFEITQGGVLDFAAAPDFESPTDSNTNNVYLVNVLAIDGTSTTTYPVTVTVININEKPAFPDSEDGHRSIDENTLAGQNIGDPVSANDPDSGDRLTYVLTGSDAEFFEIDESNGQLKTKSDLDKEDRATYYVEVDVHDGKDADGSLSTTMDASKYVTITVENVNEPPVVSGTTTTEYVEDGGGPVATYTAVDPENDNISWSPLGTDGGHFTISSNGVLAFRNPPDFEAKKEYRVEVTAFDGEHNGTLNVIITITDVNEPPDVTGRTTITFVETATGPVETFDAGDPEEGDIVWEVLGTDHTHFTITDGALTFATRPYHNSPADAGGNNEYDITIQATDDDNQSDELDVTVIVTDENEVPEFPGTTTSRDISENTAPNQNVGSPVRADDPENDILTYSLSGMDFSHFDISTSTGQILTKGDLDYEGTRNSYTVTVSVTDNKNTQGNNDPTIDNTIEVTINVIDENEGPEITAGATTTSWRENATGTVATYIAKDPEGATTTWTVHGTDAANFGITEDGDLYIDTIPDYEGKRFYQVRVQAYDGDNIADLDVTINITNADEPGVVTLSPSSPTFGIPVNAFLTDPDRVVSGVTWTWARSSDKHTWTSISGATGSAYTPVDADEGNYLQATASLR